MPEGKDRLARTSITVPETLLERFKLYCDKQRRSMSAQIAFLMEEAIKQEEGKND